MRYDYSCSSCGWTGERVVVHLVDADKQKCSNIMAMPAKNFDTNDVLPDEELIRALRICGAQLQRAEVSGNIARMCTDWARWKG